MQTKSKLNPIAVMLEKHLFSGEYFTKDQLIEAVLNYYFEFVNQSGLIIRETDLFDVREEVKNEIIHIFHETVGEKRNIYEFLKSIKNLDKRQKEIDEKYLALYMNLENNLNTWRR